MHQTEGQIVFTNKARCRDCYRCVRVCPVKAIRMEHGQAFVEPDRCIACGTCIRECPQGAKAFRDDTGKAARILAEGGQIAASVAPSFAAAFSEWERHRLPSALRQLGFTYVGETAIGAYHVAAKTAQIVAQEPEGSHVCSACPAVVSYIEAYEPELVDRITPVVSPMIAHAGHIREHLGPEAKVIFIGPCVAKKAEAERAEVEGLVDCVLTFRELTEWLQREGIDLQKLEESDFDEEPEGDARFFPVEGGSLRTAELNADLLAANSVAVCGFDELQQAFSALRDDRSPVLVEPLFCPSGCVGGPGVPREQNLYDRRRELISYAGAHRGRTPGEAWDDGILLTQFGPREVPGRQEVAEEEIRRVLALTGKTSPEDELNCGACGYASCREKAIAVIRGMAEPEMCIPYMRRLAEQRTDRIIETSPNGIVIVDDRLNIISMNPAFRRYFMCTEAVLGKRVSYLMDPDPFERVVSGAESIVETVTRHEKYHIVCHQIIYPLPEENQYVGIFVNITRSQADREKLDHLRAQTITQAQELLEHQIDMAQRIGQFLGESAAQGERLVENLMNMARSEQQSGPEEEGDRWPRNTYTSRS